MIESFKIEFNELQDKFEQIKNSSGKQRDIKDDVNMTQEIINALKGKDKIISDIVNLAQNNDLSSKIASTKLKKELKEIIGKIDKIEKTIEEVEKLKRGENKENLDNIQFLEERKKKFQNQLEDMSKDNLINKTEEFMKKLYAHQNIMKQYEQAIINNDSVHKKMIIDYLDKQDKFVNLSNYLKNIQNVEDLTKEITNIAMLRTKADNLKNEIENSKNMTQQQDTNQVGTDITQQLDPQQIAQASEQNNNNGLIVNYMPNNQNNNQSNNQNPIANNQNNNQNSVDNSQNQNAQVPIQNNNANYQPKRKYEITHVITRIAENGKYIALPKMLFEEKNIAKVTKKVGSEKETWVKIESTNGLKQFNTIEEAKLYCEAISTLEPIVLCNYSIQAEQENTNNSINNTQNNRSKRISNKIKRQTSEDDNKKHKRSLLERLKGLLNKGKKQDNQSTNQNVQPQNQQGYPSGPQQGYQNWQPQNQQGYQNVQPQYQQGYPSGPQQGYQNWQPQNQQGYQNGQPMYDQNGPQQNSR